ncbi:MAG: oxidoreductase [Corynebacterium sp.]|nr:oxidoreductase [Corynebacterium sp.]
MFDFFRKSRKSQLRPPRAPGDMIRDADWDYLQQWVRTHPQTEGFLEPETLINEMSIVLVDTAGEFTRRAVGGPKGAKKVVTELGIPVYDVEDTGYPQRMREKIERDRILRKREEQKERRARFEKQRAADDDNDVAGGARH